MPWSVAASPRMGESAHNTGNLCPTTEVGSGAARPVTGVAPVSRMGILRSSSRSDSVHIYNCFAVSSPRPAGASEFLADHCVGTLGRIHPRRATARRHYGAPVVADRAGSRCGAGDQFGHWALREVPMRPGPAAHRSADSGLSVWLLRDRPRGPGRGMTGVRALLVALASAGGRAAYLHHSATPANG